MEYIGKKQFELTYKWNDDSSSVLEIDFDFPEIFDLMKISFEFFHVLPKEPSKELVLRSFLKHIAKAVHYVSITGDYNPYGVRNKVTEMEGYPHLDGKTGFKLMTCFYPDVGLNDFEIEVVSGHQYFEPLD